MYNQSLTYYYIAMIKKCIAEGKRPEDDPALSAQYFLLVDELGENFFKFEDENQTFYIQAENESDVAQ